MNLHFYHRRFRGRVRDNYRVLLSSTISGMCIPFSDRLLSMTYRLLTHTPAKVSMIEGTFHCPLKPPLTLNTFNIYDHRTIRHGVPPLDETALARQFKSSALRRLETTQLRPTMTGPTKTEDRRGMKPYGRVQSPHRRGREFPERSESCSRRELVYGR